MSVEMANPNADQQLARPLTSVAQIARAWLRRGSWVLVIFAAAAALSIYPVITAVRWRVIGWSGDNVQYVYMTGRVAEALRSGQSPFTDPDLNYPGTLMLPETDAPFLSMIAVAPLTLLFTPTLGYNVILFFSALLSGYFTYLWIRRLTNSRFGGLVAGLVFLLSPFRVVHSYGHLQLISTQFIPLFFWALDSSLSGPAPSRRHLISLATATLLVGASSQYYVFICVFAGVAYAFLGASSRSFLLRHGWRLAASVIVGAALGSAPYLATLFGDTAYTPHSIADTRMWSASPLDFFIPSQLHPLWGSLVDRLYPRPTWIERTLYLGTVALALALAGMVWHLNGGMRRNWIWLAIAIIGAVMALGTDLHVNGQPLSQNSPLWLPAYYLAQLPFANLMRAWSRFAVITLFFIACLAGLGAATLQRRFRWGLWPAAVCAALVMLDLAPGQLTSFTLQPRDIDRWLTAQPGTFAAGFLPPNLADYMTAYGSLLHNKKIPYTNHPVHIPREYRDYMAAAADFPNQESIRALRNMGLHYLILDAQAFDGHDAPDWAQVEAALAKSNEINVVETIDGHTIVNLAPTP